MWNFPSMWENGSGNGKDNDDNNKEKTIAKAAGLVVFSGIAMSILKAANPFNNPNLNCKSSEVKATVFESVQSQVLQQSQPEPEPIVKKPNCCAEKRAKEASQNVIEIERGDTLWGLSRQYGVSIEAIKEANGLEGDTIYAGKKLVIP
ncbi:uncharacterized protein LOC107785761 [Nicotiana tabacum]|uniref:Uncharacterized protein LOC104238345 n=2 Tax=Nicotiana TaxID=4085 RepID=A0A1U7XFY4_NICSY|nr:PREDICTED: uncharacterized protein LOC104238345 [Nicotiana sylvestris]XP_016462622.1 PREDICTED: probable N-acetylmuramidase [Nicotiana tabacum]